MATQIERIVVSEFAAAEFAAVVSRRFRMRHLSRIDADHVLADFDRWHLMVERQETRSFDVSGAARLVRDFELNLAVPDAIHLAIAIAEGTPLVTFDNRLAEAARKLKHPVVVPQA